METAFILPVLAAVGIFAIAVFRNYALSNALLSAAAMGLFFAMLLWRETSDTVRQLQVALAAIGGAVAVMAHERERQRRLPQGISDPHQGP